MKSLSGLDLLRKRVLIRVDFNVPLKNKIVTDDYRLKACLPTISNILNKGASIVLVSHLGRPDEGRFDPDLSLEPVAKTLSELLNEEVKFQTDWIDGIVEKTNRVTLCENVRFLRGEASNDKALGMKMARLCDVFVNDAFACAHRAHASTCSIVSFAKISCAGPLLLAEIEALNRVMDLTEPPVTAVVGGAKVSTKINLLQNLAKKVDNLIVGGGIANSLLKASGQEIGNSLAEKESENIAEQLVKTHKNIILPEDVVCAKDFNDEAVGTIRDVSKIDKDELILDFGPRTMGKISRIIEESKTVIWNGPLGVFEFKNFQKGTKTLSQSIAKSTAFSVAGGGDTVAAINKYKVGNGISYVSTAGGAFLEYLEGRDLPALECLR